MDHIEIMEEHVGGPFVDAVLVHEGPIDHDVLVRYEEEGATPLSWSGRGREGLTVIRSNLLTEGPVLRHDPASTADGLIEAWTRVARRTARRDAR